MCDYRFSIEFKFPDNIKNNGVKTDLKNKVFSHFSKCEIWVKITVYNYFIINMLCIIEKVGQDKKQTTRVKVWFV